MKPSTQPLARTKGLVIRTIEAETLVYDFDTRETLCLDRTLATLWARCDGRTSVEQLSRLIAPAEPHATGRVLAWIAIEQLRAKGLLVPESLGRVQNKFHGLSRREMIKRAAVFGLAVPTIMMVTATASSAASACRPTGIPCTQGAQCCSNLCFMGVCATITVALPPCTTCVPGSVNPTGCPCAGTPQCTAGNVCPIAPGTSSGVCTSISGTPANPTCVPGNTMGLSATGCPCTGNPVCVPGSVCPIAPGTSSGVCTSTSGAPPSCM